MRMKMTKSLKKPNKASEHMNKLVLSGKRPCNGHKDECKPALA